MSTLLMLTLLSSPAFSQATTDNNPKSEIESALSQYHPTSTTDLKNNHAAIGSIAHEDSFADKKTGQVENPENTGQRIHLKNNMVPLSNQVYYLLDFFESKGLLKFLPMAKPYNKGYILDLLDQLLANEKLNSKERLMVEKYKNDFSFDTSGLPIAKYSSEKTFALAGFSAETSIKTGIGDEGTWALSLTAEPYFSGDLGEHLSFNAGIGLAVERLAPDLFYQSYTRDKTVVFPFQSIGYANLPYHFNYETMWGHVTPEFTSFDGPPVTDEITAGKIYHSELSGSWWDGALQFSINNQRRSWGHDQNNLTLSSTARRFPGIELRIQPAPWIRYSYLTGSLFSWANQTPYYRQSTYGYDLGHVQKNLSLQMIEFMPSKWLQITAGGGNIWSKRLEIAYLIPLVIPHLVQLDVGDHDNLSISLDIATQFDKIGKTWFNVFLDEFSITKKSDLLKMPRNRYAWQLGWKSGLLSEIIPGTSTTLKYTRVTPYVYTHYPEDDFNTFDSGRPLDMTYTHDEYNLGFYLPPNSAELNLNFLNIAIPDLILSLDNRLIMHGTNDLANQEDLLIYGDVYKPQDEDVYAYPLMDFTKDGIYDWSFQSELKFDKKMRFIKIVNYFRLVGSLGYSKTWWKSNNSGVTAPASRNLITGSIGIVAEM
jgi:hypothetical protein